MLKVLKCFLFLTIGLHLACKNDKPNEPVNTTNPAYDLAFDYREKRMVDSSYYYFNIAKEEFLSKNDSIGAGKCLVNLAIISTAKGDFFGGLETAISALDYFDEDNRQHFPFIHSNYVTLGLATSATKDYEKSYNFYLKALSYATKRHDSLITYNNLGAILQRQGRFAESLKAFKEVIKYTDEDPANYARALGNHAVASWQENPKFDPVPDLMRSRDIRDSIGDTFGLTFNYAWLFEVYRKENKSLALDYAHKMLRTAEKAKSPEERMYALRKLIILSPKAESEAYFSTYVTLTDSMQNAWSTARNQFAMIRYETKLLEVDKQILEKDNNLKSIQILLLALGIIGVIGLAVFFTRRTKFITNLQAQRSIQENRLKTSKQVHDVVANGLYRVISEIENTEFDKEQVLDKLELMYEKSRDISYQDDQTEKGDFIADLYKMVQSFHSDKQAVIFEGADVLSSLKLSKLQKDTLFIVMQEFLVNAAKHSKASQINLKLVILNNHLDLFYRDNGVGMPKNYPQNNGLKNTVSRIKQLDGVVNFVNGEDTGVQIHLKFPVS